MRRISLKLKVTLWYTVIMTVVSAIVLLAVTAIGRDMVERDISERVINTVNGAPVMMMGRGSAKPHPPRFKFYDQGVHMAVYDENYELVGGNVPFGITDEFDFENEVLRKKTYDGNRYFVYDKEIKTPDGTTLWVKGIASVTDELYAVRSVMKNNIILTIALILIASAGGYFIISRAFIPVNKISKTAKEISESSDLSRRINIGKGKDEISSLANTFDEMLDKLEKTFKREKQFTDDASHELRTPVAVILSECEYMAECAKKPIDFKESSESIKRQAEKMSKLISELLTISRMDKNSLNLNFEESDLSELVSFVCDEQAEIHEKNIELIRNIEPEVIASVDKFLIARAFINLVSNAYQYTNDGGKITVSLYEENENIVFKVSDTGIGIAQEDIPKIWERFYQADPSRNSSSSGSMGLGLSMVKWIAEKHKGKITVNSKIEHGSEFEFKIPKNQGYSA